MFLLFHFLTLNGVSPTNRTSNEVFVHSLVELRQGPNGLTQGEQFFGGTKISWVCWVSFSLKRSSGKKKHAENNEEILKKT